MFVGSYWSFLNSYKEAFWDLVDHLVISFPPQSSLYQQLLWSRFLTFVHSHWFTWRTVAYVWDPEAYFPTNILCGVRWGVVDWVTPFVNPGSHLCWLHWNHLNMVEIPQTTTTVAQAFFCCFGDSGKWEMGQYWPTPEHQCSQVGKVRFFSPMERLIGPPGINILGFFSSPGLIYSLKWIQISLLRIPLFKIGQSWEIQPS